MIGKSIDITKKATSVYSFEGNHTSIDLEENQILSNNLDVYLIISRDLEEYRVTHKGWDFRDDCTKFV